MILLMWTLDAAWACKCARLEYLVVAPGGLPCLAGETAVLDVGGWKAEQPVEDPHGDVMLRVATTAHLGGFDPLPILTCVCRAPRVSRISVVCGEREVEARVKTVGTTVVVRRFLSR